MTLKMAALPPYLKFLVPYLSSEAKTVRENGNLCREILTPLFTQRQALKAEARRNGQPEPVFNDMIDWYEQEARGTKYDPALFQTALSFVAIHTTSELLTHALTLLASEPEYIDALREEIVRVLSSEGLTKGALANLKLMDSCLKESQRYRPAAYCKLCKNPSFILFLENGAREREREREKERKKRRTTNQTCDRY
jgi:cytochrome P450